MAGTIVVINPNSTASCTAAIDRACQPLRIPGGPAIECVTLHDGPPGIESQLMADGIVVPVCEAVRARDDAAGAFVIACFSDPGLYAAREVTGKPVFGIAECAYLTALTRGERFGVISILDNSVARHRRYVRMMGIGARMAGDRALGLGVAALADDGAVFDRLVATGRALKESDGADVLILGCAGMADHRARLSHALGLPVVEPTQAAVAMAVGALLCR